MSEAGVERAPKSWLSAHLHFDAKSIYGGEADELLTEMIGPMLVALRTRDLIERFFFVRYSEAGPHLRVRLFGDSAVLSTEVRPAILDLLSKSQGRAALGRRNGKMESLMREVRWVSYEPELERYGGLAALEVAHSIFHASSTFALSVIENSLGSRSRRLGQALLAMILVIKVFVRSGGDIATFTRHLNNAAMDLLALNGALRASPAGLEGGRYGAEGLATFVSETLSRVDGNEPLTPALDTLRSALVRSHAELTALHANGLVQGLRGTIESWPLCVLWLLPSYLHMTNNRLGLTIIDECYLAQCLAQAVNQKSLTREAQYDERG